MKYFDNNWKEYKDAPDSFFKEHTYEELMEWKVAGWELPSSVCCVIRERNIKSGKIQEHVYRREHAAHAKLESLLFKPDTEFTVADHDNIYHFHDGVIGEFLGDPDLLD